jgi:hypothetical protein
MSGQVWLWQYPVPNMIIRYNAYRWELEERWVDGIITWVSHSSNVCVFLCNDFLTSSSYVLDLNA